MVKRVMVVVKSRGGSGIERDGGGKEGMIVDVFIAHVEFHLC